MDDDRKRGEKWHASRQAEKMDAGSRTMLPDIPCQRCGVRGFCGHLGRIDGEWAA
jgi:hypothetical protein